jgi:pyruvate formate lyase activating enzyme
VVSRPPPLPPIRGLDPLSLTAWEGRVSAVLWLQGCNFSCPDCKVPHLKARALDVGTIPLTGALEAVYRRRRWLDAVVLAGGEPTLHEGLDELVTMLCQFGLPVRIHTNGSRPDALREVLATGDVASVALTLRGPLDPTYSVAAGARVRLADVYEAVETLLRDPGEHEFRVPWLENVVQAEEMVAVIRMLAGARRVVIEPGADGRPGARTLRAIARRAGSAVDSCVIAGRPAEDFGALARRRGVIS